MSFGRRQPVHTVYGGAHLFNSGTTVKLSRLAVESFRKMAPDPRALSRLFGREDRSPGFQAAVHERVLRKLESEAIEDYRIDFEDGFGVRSPEEEDAEAERAAGEMGDACVKGELPPLCGIRIRDFGVAGRARGARTLEIFVTALCQRLGGTIPPRFAVTLPKAESVEQVAALRAQLEELEKGLSLRSGLLELELMVESPRVLSSGTGGSPLPLMVEEARGRCRGVHFGVYDYTAELGILSASQGLIHPAADFARGLIQVLLAGTGIALSDGATHILPVGKDETKRVQALRLCHANVGHALNCGYYQGWDLHPAQIPARFAAVHAFYLENLEVMTERMKAFSEKSRRTSLADGVFDDAASGRGLLDFFVRGFQCGALKESELAEAGIIPPAGPF